MFSHVQGFENLFHQQISSKFPFVIDEVIFKNDLQQKCSEQPNVSIQQLNKG